MNTGLEYMVEEIVVVKNGNAIHFLTYEIDELKPKCWVDGYEYRFNSHLVSQISIDEKESNSDDNKDTCIGH